MIGVCMTAALVGVDDYVQMYNLALRSSPCRAAGEDAGVQHGLAAELPNPDPCLSGVRILPNY